MYTAEIVFKNGVRGTLAYPDAYDLFVSAGDVPDQDVIAVIELLRGEGSLPKQNMLERMQGDIRHYTRLYRLAALCILEPRLVLMRRKCPDCGHTWDGEIKSCDNCMSVDSRVVHDRAAGELSPRDLTFLDLIAIQREFFWSATATISPFAAQDAGGAADVVHTGRDIPYDTGAIAGDSGADVGDQPE